VSRLQWHLCRKISMDNSEASASEETKSLRASLFKREDIYEGVDTEHWHLCLDQDRHFELEQER
jgi:hypothetical protein